MAYATFADATDKLYRILYAFELHFGYSPMADNKELPAGVTGGTNSVTVDEWVAKVGIAPADAVAVANGYNAWKQTSTYQQGQASPVYGQTGNAVGNIVNQFHP